MKYADLLSAVSDIVSSANPAPLRVAVHKDADYPKLAEDLIALDATLAVVVPTSVNLGRVTDSPTKRAAVFPRLTCSVFIAANRWVPSESEAAQSDALDLVDSLCSALTYAELGEGWHSLPSSANPVELPSEITGRCVWILTVDVFHENDPLFK